MPFRCDLPPTDFTRPIFSIILGNTLLSTLPGISGAGPTPKKTLFTPNLDSELVLNGSIQSQPSKPNTPTGCPTPATITRAMMELMDLTPLFINAGLVNPPVIPCLDVYGVPGRDPRTQDAVPKAEELYERGYWVGRYFSRCGDLLVLGECVPGGTTTALCVLRALGYKAQVSSSFITNPLHLKQEVCDMVVARIGREGITNPLDIVRYAGDPMLAVAPGIVQGFQGQVMLAGGTQMLAVSAVLSKMGVSLPSIGTTEYVKGDPSASFEKTAREIGVQAYYIDPDFGDLGHTGLARYCIGEVKEGMGAGGAMILACMLGFGPEEIRGKIFQVVQAFS
ncbi:MAG: TIGR00303 family protein [Methanomicrobiales archaeon]|nr:TIGR00303 family protein [Methanomicrobiales archaeon]